MELIVLIVLVVLVLLLVLGRGGADSLLGLVINGIVGVVLLFVTNLLVLAEDIPINLITILICAIGGVFGYLLILVLHLLGIAFSV